jgi:hypothetical protein
MQPIEEAIQQAANAAIAPVIAMAVSMEDELYWGGSKPTGDVRFGMARVDFPNDDRWWSGSRWVKKWHKEAALFDIWGNRTA